MTHQFLTTEEINLIKKELDKYNQDWEDGRKTAGSHASKVKNNIQLSRESEVSKKFTKFIIEKLNKDQLIKSFSLSKKIHGTIFTKSKKGMKYGRHIDNTFMSTGRADLSFTLFLSNVDSYEGGELIIENINSKNTFKLNAGQILIYPSTYLHSIQEVTQGERLVFIGWIESYVKSIEEREYLFDLDAGARGILAKNGRSDELDLIFKSYSNFLRLLGS
ncbi:Iron-uptake factor PiuC [Prochlorococcus marinus str. GP2]|uniref:Iron-uptake factor PiuC n=1 Tax=Prochlorococcus marinus str. GP2 TaxID=59925 RepID=A0A0A1ZAU6_PROMR|nr:Iron-uptake factor PiuC [Prochlorococcus marinus str. GP2]